RRTRRVSLSLPIVAVTNVAGGPPFGLSFRSCDAANPRSRPARGSGRWSLPQSSCGGRGRCTCGNTESLPICSALQCRAGTPRRPRRATARLTPSDEQLLREADTLSALFGSVRRFALGRRTGKNRALLVALYDRLFTKRRIRSFPTMRTIAHGCVPRAR